MSWFSNFNGGKDVAYLVFSFASHKYFVYAINDDVLKAFNIITKVVFKRVIMKVKEECDRATWDFLAKLPCHLENMKS